MTQRAKLELQLNKPLEIELLYDEPVTGNNAYGNYYLYAVKAGSNEYSFFAPETVHNELKILSRGDRAIVSKTAQQKGSKVVTNYHVTLPDIPEEEIKSPVNDPSTATATKTKTKTDCYADIMMRCYSDALAIQEELGTMIDVSRIAITLFIARSKTNGNTIKTEVL